MMAKRSEVFYMRAFGPWACFTKPELRAERMSYEVPTVAAIRGLYDAVLWHPGMYWQPTEMVVLNPIRWFSMRTNELKDMTSGNIEAKRTQRQTVGLRDVNYIFGAYFELSEEAEHTVTAFSEMFTRWLARGHRRHDPYFGMFPFLADLVPAPEKYRGIDQGVNRPLGRMLYDRDYTTEPARTLTWEPRMVSGTIAIPHRLDVTHVR